MYGNMYDPAPQFAFPGSQIGTLPSTLDSINPQYYQQIAAFLAAKFGSPERARLASIQGIVLYDTVRVDQGVMPLRDFDFFQTPVGQQQGLFIAGTQYTKQKIDCHPWLTNGGQLSRGYECLIWSIGVQFHIVQSLDDTVQVAPSNAIDLTLLPGLATTQAEADVVLMSNVMRAFQEGLHFEFFINQTPFESGPGWRFPSGCYGISGFNAIANTLTSEITADGAVNNGFGWAYQFPVMRHIPELTKFGVTMSVQNPFNMTGNQRVRIVTTLEGIGIGPVTG
jgi:hypothetical protein